MKVEIDGIEYNSAYNPFRKNGTEYEFVYPNIKPEFIYIEEDDLQSYLEMMLREYGLEDNDALSTKALVIKSEIRQLFGLE